MKAVEVRTADPRVKGADLAIIGWSQGGLVATAVAGRSGIPDAVALCAAVVTPKETFSSLLGAETVEKGMATGDTPLPITLPWGAVIELKQGFLDGFAALDPLKEIAADTGQWFVAQGTKDTTVASTSAHKLIEAHQGMEDRCNAEMDHVFNAFTGPQTLDEMVGKTIHFFDAHLK